MTENTVRKRRRIAPDEAIITGIWWTDSRNLIRLYLEEGVTAHPEHGGDIIAYAYAYLRSGMKSVPAARAALEKEQRGHKPRWKGFLPSDGNFHALRACQRFSAIVGDLGPDRIELAMVMEEIGMAHDAHAKMMDDLGYEEIKGSDQERLRNEKKVGGGGGGR